ncbi:gastrula zinc finger protein XlCGF28.1-like, partial [Silurus meridionalis]
ICRGILNFLTNRPQSVRLGKQVSSTLIVNTSIPQGCVLSPLLYSMRHFPVYRGITIEFNGTASLHNSNIFIKYACNMTPPVTGQISNNEESAYREETRSLTAWCASNNLTLNTMKTKELIVDFQKSNSRRHFPVYRGSTDLSWHQNSSALVKEAQHHLYFLSSLEKTHLSTGILSFNLCIIESILTNSITVWYGGSTVCERKALLPNASLAPNYLPVSTFTRCLCRAHNIIRDSSHPSHKLVNLLPSRRRYRNIPTRTSRFMASHF